MFSYLAIHTFLPLKSLSFYFQAKAISLFLTFFFKYSNIDKLQTNTINTCVPSLSSSVVNILSHLLTCSHLLFLYTHTYSYLLSPVHLQSRADRYSLSLLNDQSLSLLESSQVFSVTSHSGSSFTLTR